MRDWVSEWVQEGRLYVWRYFEPGQAWRGWHFTADPVGCRSIRNLLDRMHGGEPRHRTLRLAQVTGAILSVPNYAHKIAGGFEKMRIEYVPDFDELRMTPSGVALTMTIGDRRVGELSAAFADVEAGIGDFGIATSDAKRAETWMFWWLPRIANQDGRRT